MSMVADIVAINNNNENAYTSHYFFFIKRHFFCITFPEKKMLAVLTLTIRDKVGILTCECYVLFEEVYLK